GGPDPRECGRPRLDCDGAANGAHAGPCRAGEPKTRGRHGGRTPRSPARPVRRASGGRRSDRLPSFGAGRVPHGEYHPDRWRAVPRVVLTRPVTTPGRALDLLLRLLARDVRTRPAR